MKSVLMVPLSGFCPGVTRAVNLVKEALKTGDLVFFKVPIVHNNQVMRELEDEGIEPFNHLIKDASGATFAVSAHGIAPKELKEIEDKGYRIVDTTCTIVKSFQNIAIRYAKDNHGIYIFGKRNHPEIIGVVGHVREYTDEVFVIESFDEANNVYISSKPIALFCQTTWNREEFKKIQEVLKIRNPKIEVIDTICRIVEKRLEAAIENAKKVSCMLVVGSRASSNTRRLVEAISQVNQNVFQIEEDDDLEKAKISIIEKQFDLIGLTAGSSTSPERVNQIARELGDL